MVAERKDVLLVPNAALRWAPQPDQIVAAFRRSPKKERHGQGGAQAKTPDKEKKPNSTRGILWLPEGKEVKPLKVKVGLTDGTMTEVSNPELKPGMQVVVAELEKGEEPSNSASPFTPQFFRRHQ
jgi:HlyD family secretion protein